MSHDVPQEARQDDPLRIELSEALRAIDKAHATQTGEQGGVG